MTVRIQRAVVFLSQEQMALAATVAEELHGKLRAAGVKDGHGARPEDMTPEVEAGGSAAEIAAALFLGVPWTAQHADDPYGADVGLRTQIRSTNKVRHSHSLIVRQRDLQKYGNVPFILVVQTGNRFELKGWAMAYDVKTRGREWDGGDHSRPPAYFLHESQLQPMATLTAP